jgi:hypothetical protein
MTEERPCPECGAGVPTGRLSCGACGALLASVEGRRASQSAPIVASLPPAAFPPRSPAASPPAPPASAPVAAPVAAPIPPATPAPGSYLPPSAVMRNPAAAAPAPASSPVSLPVEPEPGTTAPGHPARVPVLDLPFAIAPGIGPRLVAAGAALAVVAFVMPWTPDRGTTIGGAPATGFFATWGLAAIGNVLPFLVAWASLLLAVFPNRVPREATLGLLPVALGGFLAGIGWTYLIALPGIGIGLWALAGSAVLLFAGGLHDLRTGRAARNRA